MLMPEDQAYMFDGNQYVRYDFSNLKLVSGYPYDWTGCELSHQVTVEDVEAVADAYGIPITTDEAQQIVEALPLIDCDYFASSSRRRTLVPQSLLGIFKESVIASAIGCAIGATATAVFTLGIGAGAGCALGAGLSLAVVNIATTQLPDVSADRYDHSPIDEEKTTYIYYDSFPSGPFQNINWLQDLEKVSQFPIYGEIPLCGAIEPPNGDSQTVQVWYPESKSTNEIQHDPRYKAMPLIINVGNDPDAEYYKYIFIIVAIDEQNEDGFQAYQLRINPEDPYQGEGLDIYKRVTHSQLTTGSRLYAMMFNGPMEVYAAGQLYIGSEDNEIKGIDTKSGHYHSGWNGNDQEIIDNTKDFLSKLGYDMTNVWGVKGSA